MQISDGQWFLNHCYALIIYIYWYFAQEKRFQISASHPEVLPVAIESGLPDLKEFLNVEIYRDIISVNTVHHQVFCTFKMSEIAQKSSDDKKIGDFDKKVETYRFHVKL